MKRAVVAALVALTFMVGVAGAAQIGDSRVVQRAPLAVPAEGWGAAELRIATAYWGTATPPLCGSLSVEFDVALPPSVYGEATLPTEPGTACWMKIAAAKVTRGLYQHCVTVVHECGHWLGLPAFADHVR